MNSLFSIFFITLVLFSTEISFARTHRAKAEKRIAAKECRDKNKKGKYKNEGKVCIALKKNPERTGRCRNGYCKE